MSILERVYQLRIQMFRNNREPLTIYMGNEEYMQFKNEIEASKHYDPRTVEQTLMGMEIVRVQRHSYLRAGE